MKNKIKIHYPNKNKILMKIKILIEKNKQFNYKIRIIMKTIKILILKNYDNKILLIKMKIKIQKNKGYNHKNQKSRKIKNKKNKKYHFYKIQLKQTIKI